MQPTKTNSKKVSIMTHSADLYRSNDNYRAATDAIIATRKEAMMLARMDTAIIEFLEANQCSDFYSNLYTQAKNYGKLSEKQTACVQKEIDKKDSNKNIRYGAQAYLCDIVKRSKGVVYIEDKTKGFSGSFPSSRGKKGGVMAVWVKNGTIVDYK